jgi:hypothetical protein
LAVSVGYLGIRPSHLVYVIGFTLVSLLALLAVYQEN